MDTPDNELKRKHPEMMEFLKVVLKKMRFDEEINRIYPEIDDEKERNAMCQLVIDEVTNRLTAYQEGKNVIYNDLTRHQKVVTKFFNFVLSLLDKNGESDYDRREKRHKSSNPDDLQ
jgi:hypothetical protein